jgi:lipopolysaccharide transport system ATP-binding protein
MSDIAIHVENLGKLYRIGERQRYKALRDTFSNALYAPFRAAASLFNGHGPTAPRRSSNQDFWSLKNVSFDIKKGEAVGIIGRNGAGKSTLLKILSRITKPTEGYVGIRGRVGSLLEVGTGFHPELTGRENIYLNAAIIGMKKKEIDRKFDEIVAFAEIEKFLDTPVKFYSSGMYIRLAFAVAAHLESEILLVDEVLAVGDAAFQKKCLGKMGDVAKEGRTVLFVSHNLPAVLALCQRAILLDSGRVLSDGSNTKVVDRYLQGLERIRDVSLAERLDRRGNQALRFTAFELRDSSGSPALRVSSGKEINIALKYQANTNNGSLRKVHVAIGVHGMCDEPLFLLSTKVNGFDFEEIPVSGVIICKVPSVPLQSGRYSFNLFCTVGTEIADWIQNAGFFEVEAGDFFGSGRLPPPDQGAFLMKHSWAIVHTKNPALRSSLHESR